MFVLQTLLIFFTTIMVHPAEGLKEQWYEAKFFHNESLTSSDEAAIFEPSEKRQKR